MALPNSNISTTLVGNTLGSSSKDIGTLCTHPNINKWARWKPIRLNKLTPVTETDLNTMVYGLNSPTDDTNDYQIALQPWFYERPRGGANTEFFRIGDFRNYEHNAIPPVSIPQPSRYVTIEPGINFSIECEPTPFDPNQISLFDLNGILGLGNWYFAVLFRTPLGQVYIKTCDFPILQAGYDVTFTSDAPFFDYDTVGLYFVLSRERIQTITDITAIGFNILRPLPSDTNYYQVPVIKDMEAMFQVDIMSIADSQFGSYFTFGNFYESVTPAQWFNTNYSGGGFFFITLTNWGYDPFLLERQYIRIGVTKRLDGSTASSTYEPQMYDSQGFAINSINIPAGGVVQIYLGDDQLFTEHGWILPSLGQQVVTAIKLEYAFYDTSVFLNWYQSENIRVQYQ